jgi:phospholipase/lecithinase/hemolysin
MKMMRPFLALLAFAMAPQAHAQAKYSSLLVFGDSLTDSGNAYLGTAGAQANPANGYYLGRFSNGLNYADDLSLALFGTPTVPALLPGGLNFSVGGAEAQFKSGEVSPSFLAQVGLYSTLVGKPIPSDALVLVTFGGNDVRDTILTGGPIDFSPSAVDFATAIFDLYGLGARNFLIVGTPDIGLLPVSIATAGGIPGRLGDLTLRSEEINALFRTETRDIHGFLPGAHGSFFDLFDFEHDLLANPSAYGLPATLDSTTPCQIPGGGSPQIVNCANSLYFDPIHPTAQGHTAIANALLARLSVPEPSIWVTMILGFLTIGIMVRRAGRLAATA